MDPRRSALYLFCGKRCDRTKALLWEGDGFLLLYKRMEAQGRFRWPRNPEEVRTLTWQQFGWLMPGLETEQLKRRFLMADEARVQVLKEPGRSAETDSYMWLFCTREDGLPPVILYKYTETRAKSNAEEFLKGFKGYLETDGCQGYNNLPDIKRCCCWAHLRRYFVEAVPKGKELDYSNPAAQAVQYCSKLFEYERMSQQKGHTHEQRKEYRLQKEKPVLDVLDMAPTAVP